MAFNHFKARRLENLTESEIRENEDRDFTIPVDGKWEFGEEEFSIGFWFEPNIPWYKKLWYNLFGYPDFYYNKSWYKRLWDNIIGKKYPLRIYRILWTQRKK